jgi:hypothetical protein
VLVLAALAALFGCAPTPEAIAAMDQQDAQRCLSFGFQPGTNDYGMCRMQLAQERAASDERRRMAAAYALQNMSDNYYRAAAANPTVTVNCLGCY